VDRTWGSSRTERGRRLAAATVVAAALTCGCTGTTGPAAPGPPDGTTAVPRDRLTFADVDAAMQQRVDEIGLPGAADLAVREGRVLHRRTYGSYAFDTVVPIASASKWLTSATIMTLVDEGKLALDDPVSRFLPSWSARRTTIRQLLSHQAGLAGSAGCLGRAALRSCADEIGAAPEVYAPGTEFHYGNAGYTVAAAVAEVAGGVAFEELFEARIARPLGLAHTTFGEDLTPAASGRSTLDDFGAFVAMMAADGVTPSGARVLTAESVREIERDQLHGLDTHNDFAVQITTFGTYGLGVWRDRSAADGTTQMVSGSGSVGFYPWIDRERHAYGVLLVNDGAGGSGRAVRTSSRIVHDLVLPALDNAD